MQDVKCGCGIPSDVEWFDAIFGGVMQNGLCGVVYSVMCNLYLNVVMCAWCGVR